MFSIGLWCAVLFALLKISSFEEVQQIHSSALRPNAKELKHSDDDHADSKLKITIFYESECPDCVSFFKEQLQPNFRLFSREVAINYVPYGNAQQTKHENGTYTFECQHGDPECRENKFQVCAIEKLKKKPQMVNKFIACYMSKKNKQAAALKCSKQNKVDLKKLKSCAGSTKGDELLAKMGNITHKFNPKIQWVPTIVFNDVYNEVDSKRATENLRALLCEKLNNEPKVCEKLQHSS